jgi:hypothetical protein
VCLVLRRYLKWYRMVFAVFLAWTLDKYGKNSGPVSTASMALSLSELGTLVWLTVSMDLIFGVFHIKLGHEKIVIACGVSIYILIRIVNYLLCIYRKAYVPVLEEFNAKGERYRKRAFALMWGYIWGTLAAFAIVGVIGIRIVLSR